MPIYWLWHGLGLKFTGVCCHRFPSARVELKLLSNVDAGRVRFQGAYHSGEQVKALTDPIEGPGPKRKFVVKKSGKAVVASDGSADNRYTSVTRPISNDFWQRVELFVPTDGTLKAQRVIAGQSSELAAVPIAMLRTQLLQVMKTHDLDAFAVSSPTAGCGSSFLAMNLAFSMARLRSLRVLLLDLDLSRPALAPRLAVPDTAGEIAKIGVSTTWPARFVRLGDNLMLGYASQPVQQSSEILQDMSDGGIVDQLRQALRPDVIICDTPPILRSDDLVALAPQLGGVLVVADGQSTTPGDLRKAEALLEDRTRLIGVVLNRGSGG
jgi:Mrp family chromosome partitioning ATPase